jgi:serine/threonine protein kinase/tetratricopeptide (TPR) repeat protein
MHPSREALARYIEGSLPESERLAVSAELARCADCRLAVAALTRSSRLAEWPIPATLEHASEERALEKLGPGATLAERYRVVRCLGEGGMGVVYEVEHTLLGRTFALKTLHAAMTASADAVRRLLGEARALASLGHEGLVEVIDVGIDDAGLPFLVMPVLRGETLEVSLAREPVWSIERTLGVAEQLAQALAFAHGRGVVHRDVKPANIFLVSAGEGDQVRVKLLDFGIAKLHEPEWARTRTGLRLGTPSYMAPEQWNRPREVDARADVFAWGLTVYRMLAGELPYTWSDVMAGRNVEAPDLRARRVDVPVALVDLLERAIALEPGDRPRDAGVLAAELASLRPRRSLYPSTLRPERADERTSPSETALSVAVEPVSSSQRRTSSPAADAGASGGGDRVTPMLGREVDLSRVLDAALRPRPVWIEGPQGIGKTTLLEAVARGLFGAGREVLFVRGSASSRHLPFAALRAILTSTEGPESEGPESEESIALALRARLGRPDVALLVDDAEALDRQSFALLASIGAGTARGPLLVAASSRPCADEYAQGLGVECVALEGLDHDAVRAWLSQTGPADDAWVERLGARTGGNPLFILQCLALEAVDAEDEDALTSPRALAEAIIARLEAAPDHAAIAWQLAVVLGSFPGITIHAKDLGALGAPRPEEGLGWLVAARVLEPIGAGAAEHRFRSEVLRVAVHSAMGEGTRREHHRIAARLRRRGLPVEAEPRRWAEVAHHLEQAYDRVGASDAYALAVLGTRAICVEPSGTPPVSNARVSVGLRQDLSFEAAVRWAERARALAAAAGIVRQDESELSLVEVEALEARGRFAEVVARIEALAPTLSDLRLARALVHLGTALQRGGEGGRALEAFARASQVARAASDDGGRRSGVLALALGRYAVGLAFAGDVGAARDRLAEAEALVLRGPWTALRPDLAGWRAQVAGIAGDLGESREAYWAAVELFRASGNARFAAYALLNLGDTYARLGAYAEAERTLRRAHAECEALGATVMTGYAAINLARTLALLDCGAEARGWIDRAVQVARETAEPRLRRYAALYAAQLAITLGADAAEVASAIAALAACVPDGPPGEVDASFVVQALTVLARAALREASSARALALAERAMATLEEAGALDEGEAELHLVLADALDAEHRRGEAREVLRSGARRVKASARRIAGAIYRGHYLEDVPAHRELLARAG